MESVARRLPVSRARAGEFADFTDDTGRQRDQIARRQAVAAAPRVGRRGAHGGGRHYVRRRGGFHQALCDAAPLAFAGRAHEVVALQGAQVVVHFLAWKGEARGKGGRRRGLRQFGQEPRADRVERGGGGLRRLYDLDIQHEGIRTLTN